MSMGNSSNRWGVVWVVFGSAVLIICGLLSGGLFHHTALQPVLVLHRPVVTPVTLRDRIQGSIPQTWASVQRLTDRLLGARKPVNLNTAVFTGGQISVAQLEELAGGRSARVPSEGPAVWFLDSANLKQLRARLEADPTNQIYYGRILSADGISAGLFMGQTVVANGSTNQVGLETSYFARAGQEATDLFADVLLSKAVTNDLAEAPGNRSDIHIRTNADIAVRLQVPKGKGVFLVQTPAGPETGTRAGFILDPL